MGRFFGLNGTFLTMFTNLKLNIAPEQTPGPNRKGSSSNHPFFMVELLNFGSVLIDSTQSIIASQPY